MAEAQTAAHWRAEKSQPIEDSGSPRILAAHQVQATSGAVLKVVAAQAKTIGNTDPASQVEALSTLLPATFTSSAQLTAQPISEDKPEAEGKFGHVSLKSDSKKESASIANKVPSGTSLTTGSTCLVSDNGKTTLQTATALPDNRLTKTVHAPQETEAEWSLPIAEELGTILEDSAATHGRPGVRPADTRLTHLLKQGLGLSWGLASWGFGTATGVIQSTASSATAAGNTLVDTIGAARAVGSGVLHAVSCRANAVGAHLRKEGDQVSRAAAVAAERNAAALQQYATQAAAAALNRSLSSVKVTVDRLAGAVSVSLDKTGDVIYTTTGAACGIVRGLALAAAKAREDRGPAKKGSSSKVPSAKSSLSVDQKSWNRLGKTMSHSWDEGWDLVYGLVGMGCGLMQGFASVMPRLM